MKVLVTDRIFKEGLDILDKAHVEVDIKLGLKPEELKGIIGNYDALIVRSQTKVTAEVIKAGRKLRVVARAGTGVDNIDVNEATREGILVVNAPTANTIAVVEHVFGLMLALIRHIPQANNKLMSGVWGKSEFMGTELKGKTLGIIGLGKIGAELAKRAQAFEMKVITYSPSIPSERAAKLGVKLMSLEELLKEADFISLHTKMAPGKRGMIGKKELALVKPTARIVNCARGGLIDEKAMAKALKKNKIAGVAVDVYSEEPTTDCVLFECTNIISTPHLAAFTTEAHTAAAICVTEQIIDVFNGKPPKYQVNTPSVRK
ncbi:hydroxyacid dehydrogenase [Chloroflexota bacterium]